MNGSGCGGGSNTGGIRSRRFLSGADFACRKDLSGDRPDGARTGGTKVTLFVDGRVVEMWVMGGRWVSRLLGGFDGKSIPKGTKGSWKISKRRVEAIVYDNEEHFRLAVVLMQSTRHVCSKN